MKKMFLLSIFIIITIMNLNLFGQVDYFPLTKGSTWTYLNYDYMNQRTDSMVVTITGTEKINNHDFTVLTINCSQLNPPFYNIYYEYYRKELSGVFAYESNTEQIKYKFDEDSGSVWVYFSEKTNHENRTFTVAKKNYSTRKNSVDYNNCIAIFSISNYGLDTDLYEEFAPGIGRISSTNSLGGTWNLISYSIATDIPPLENNSIEISIAPNPASDYIDILLPNVIMSEVKDLGIRIYDVLGVVTHIPSNLTPCSSPTGEGGQIRINVSALPPGVYFVRVGEEVRKFAKI